MSRLSLQGLKTAVLTACLAACAVAAADGMEKTDAPIEIKVTPGLATPGGKVTLSGTTVPFKDTAVAFSIKPPVGAAKSLSAKPGTDGTFSVDFKDTTAEGSYAVTATAPDGKTQAQGSFKVVSIAGINTEATAGLNDMLDAIGKANTDIDDLAATLPPSPALTTFQQKFSTFKQEFAKGPQAMAGFHDAIGIIDGIVKDHPDLAEPLQPLYDGLADGSKQLESKTAEIQATLSRSKAAGVSCNDLDTLNEGLTMISTGLNLSKKVVETAKNFVVDKVPGLIAEAASRAGSQSYSDAQKAALTESIKAAATKLAATKQAGGDGPISWGSTVAGFLNDAIQFGAQQFFAKYCEKFEGPMDAQFRVEMRTENTPYLRYLVQMQGKLVLRYAKSSSPTPTVSLTGQIEGNAFPVKAWEEAWHVDPTIRQTQIMARLLYPPVGTPYIESAGSIARAATLGNFYIPVHGELVKGHIKLQIDPARVDFSDAMKVRLYYVFFAIVPQIVKVELPIQPAFFIFDRGTHSKPEFDVKTDSSASTIDQTFTRDETVDSGQVEVEWKIHLKACNPGCLPFRP